MKYGIDLPNMRECADPHLLADLARDAEDAGWDGAFLFDSLYSTSWGSDGPVPAADPWIALAAMAANTERVRLGPMIAPLSRYKPWQLARATVTLDHLSNGRLVLPVGLGHVEDGGYANVGEELDRKKRAAMLDESLAILGGLWSGVPFSSSGEHYQVGEMTFLPKPVQQPRIPVWVVGAWPREKSMRRAAQWDGVLPVVFDGGEAAQPDPAEVGRRIEADGAYQPVEPDALAAIAEYGRSSRNGVPFEIVIEGWSAGSQKGRAAARVAAYATSGATWWIEAVWSYLYLAPHDVERMRRRIRQGPPRIS